MAPHSDVIALSTEAEGSLCSETSDNPLAILLNYGSARVLLADDAEVREGVHSEGLTPGSLTVTVTVTRTNSG